MEPNDPDAAIRMAAFERVRLLNQLYAGSIPWSAIAEGFEFGSQQILLGNLPRGIFKPAQMSGLLSIKTSIPKPHQQAWYDDQILEHHPILREETVIPYDFMRGDPWSGPNKLLLSAHEQRTPVIYFCGLSPGQYAAFRVFVVNWDSNSRRALIAFADWERTDTRFPSADDDRRYYLRTARTRLHQSRFRDVLLRAYSERCAITGLPNPQLLDAAHIIPDSEEGGLPRVSNGILMSKTHHAAFDANLIGIDRGCRVHVSRRLLDDRDGPTLQAIQGLHGRSLHLPRRRVDHPDPALLAERFERFRERESG